MNCNWIARFFLPVLLAFASAATASAQTNAICTPDASWIPAGRGLPGATSLFTEMDGVLYAFHTIPLHPSDSSIYGISRWDGSDWSLVTRFSAEGDKDNPDIPVFFSTMKGYKGMIFLGGMFSAINGDPELSGLAKWDGSAWSPARWDSRINHTVALEIHNDELCAAVKFSTAAGNPIISLAAWNGTAWRAFSSPQIPISQHSTILTLRSWQGALYAGGNTAPGDEGKKIIAMKWENGSWTSLSGGEYGSINDFIIYRDEIYAVKSMGYPSRGTLQLAPLNEDSPPLLDIPLPLVIPRFTVHEDDIYMLVAALFEEHSSFSNIHRFDGTQWREISNTNGGMLLMASYKKRLFLGGWFNGSCGADINCVAMLCDARSCGRISGTIYHEANSDCIRDTNEKGLAGRLVKISPNNRYAVTDTQGNYSAFVEDGSYSISAVSRGYWQQVCPLPPSESHVVTISGGKNSTGNDFGTQPLSGIRDLRVSVVAGPAREGRQLEYVITYENAGTVTMDGTVHFQPDPILAFDSAQAPATRFSPGIAEWDFTGLAMEESRTIRVWTTVPVGVSVGTNICSRLWITPENIEVASNNDRDSVCVAVTGSYDPNDIQVTPLGREGNGVITPRDSVLTYWVRFQNTGNDTAFKVVVVDTLSSHLDISSIKLGAASHPFSFSIDKSNVLVWTFNDIMLPDSTASEINSHGFFKFSVKLKRDLPGLTEIANQVHIYFDYNAPVATNTVVSVLGASMGVERPAAADALAIYPNPAREQATINAQLRAGGTLEVRNILGETMKSYRYDGGASITIDLRDLPAGIYLVTAETMQGVQAQQITVVR